VKFAFSFSSVKPWSGFNWCLIPSGVLGISLFGALERTHCWKSVDVVVVKHYDLLGKIRELYVTSGFSSGTHNSCRLICLRFNPVKMSKWKRHFLFYILLVELVTKGVFKLLWILVFGRLKLKIARLKKILTGRILLRRTCF